MCLDTSIQNWLSLIHLKGLGPTKLQQLFEHFGSIKALLEADLSALGNAGLSQSLSQKLINVSKSSKSQRFVNYCNALAAWLETDHRCVIPYDSDLYPSLLRETVGPPAVLYAEGNLDLLSQPGIAVVGSRNPSPQGAELAHELASGLASAGFVVTSGLAIGVDTRAHVGALNVSGATIAVLGTGLDKVYPRQNIGLAEKIRSHGGLLVSEMPLGSSARPQNFPRRNRIVSGLSLGVLVIEAGLSSGSLISARYALEQNRDVFAVPGMIKNPMSKGPHALIKQGAKLTESVDDILDDYGHLLDSESCSNEPPGLDDSNLNLNDEQKHLLSAMGWGISSSDELIERSGFDVSKLSELVFQLELEGLVSSVPGGHQRLK